MRLSLKQLKNLAKTPPWDWPEGLGLGLLLVLRDPGATEQELLLAVEMAGDPVVVNDDLVGALLAVLQNGQASEDLRGAAAIALGPALELADTEYIGTEDSDVDPEMVPIRRPTFGETQKALRSLYLDANLPKLVRRRILEASVRAPEAWHDDAIRAAYATGDEEWMLTAVFAMQYVRGFDEQILASLKSTHPGIHREAIRAAGAWELQAAWPHVVDLVSAADTDKGLLLAAITAVGEIRPKEAPGVLAHLQESDDPDVAETVLEVTSSAHGDDEDFEVEADDDDLLH